MRFRFQLVVVWIFGIVVLSGMVTGLTVGITGCAGTSVQRAAINTLYTSGHTVDTAFKGYLDLVLTKQLPTNDVPRIAKLYTDFQTAFGAALTLASFNTNAPPTPEVKNAESQLLLSIAAVKKGSK